MSVLFSNVLLPSVAIGIIIVFSRLLFRKEACPSGFLAQCRQRRGLVVVHIFMRGGQQKQAKAGINELEEQPEASFVN